MNKPLLILGSGGHAQVLLSILIQQGYHILGLTDAQPHLTGQNRHGFPILGNDEVILSYDPETIQLVNGVGSIATTQTRSRLFLNLRQHGYTFQEVLHPTALFESHSQRGAGCQLLAGAIVVNGVQLGDNVLINTRAVIEHDCQIGSHCHIASGAVLCGGCLIGQGTHIGANATVLQGIEIGANAVIGAGSVVTRTVPAATCVVGVPAKVIV